MPVISGTRVHYLRAYWFRKNMEPVESPLGNCSGCSLRSLEFCNRLSCSYTVNDEITYVYWIAKGQNRSYFLMNSSPSGFIRWMNKTSPEETMRVSERLIKKVVQKNLEH